MGATSTDWAGAAAGAAPAPAAAPPAVGALPLVGVAAALLPKIALMIFPKMLIVCSQRTRTGCEGLGETPGWLPATPSRIVASPTRLANAGRRCSTGGTLKISTAVVTTQ